MQLDWRRTGRFPARMDGECTLGPSIPKGGVVLSVTFLFADAMVISYARVFGTADKNAHDCAALRPEGDSSRYSIGLSLCEI